MKIRNKKTGQILEDVKSIEIYYLDNGVLRIETERDYHSFLQNWEDYEPVDPLIKDERIRKAVRAWAEASYLRGAIFDFDDGTMMLRGVKSRASISFDGLDFCEFNHITAGYHTIAELCGEEEE